MIIKSMSRKDASFGQLMDYMESDRADSNFTIYHNLYSRHQNEVKAEFKRNSEYLKRRKNGNYLYHEVISITRSNKISLAQQKQKLRDIVYQYVQERAGKNLAYAAMHDDKEDNLHYHVIISANEVASQKRHRLSKSKFDSIKNNLEDRVLTRYPELDQTQAINKRSKNNQSQKEFEAAKRDKKPTQREQVKETLKNIFSNSKSKSEFFNALHSNGYELYVRGNTPGVKNINTGRKYRIKTLGLVNEFQKVDQLLTKKTEDKTKQKSQKQTNSSTPKSPNQSKTKRVIDSEKLNTNKQQKTKRTINTDRLNARDTLRKNLKNPQKITQSRIFREWIMGDFSQRKIDSIIKEHNAIRKRTVSKNYDLTTSEVIREWVLGDFSARKQIAKALNAEKYQERFRQLKQSKLSNRDQLKEWLKGDFKTREENTKINKGHQTITDAMETIFSELSKQTIQHERQSRIKESEQKTRDKTQQNETQQSNAQSKSGGKSK